MSEPLTEPPSSTAPRTSGQGRNGQAATTPGEVQRTPGPQSAPPRSEFADLYNEHSRAIYYLALRFLSDPQKAEDATHDVFLKAFRKMDQFRGESSWRTWLYRITINHCRNLQQAWNERHMFSNADDGVFENAPSQTDSPFRVLETKELGQRIQQALDGVSAEYRLLLLLVADEQLSYEQVGALTEQTADAVRGKLHRARKAFAVLFQKTA
ncbi:MAG TPA: RNA polymerase sigma factor [Candidatus Binatia bacterium]|nr:RNA polymerase sigma factor [Candidatus Binatia bacterium]